MEVHHKIYSSFKKMFSTLEENIFLGLHPDIVYLLSSKDRSVTAKFTYSQLSLVETRPNSIVLELLHSPTSLILKSQLAFEISKIFTIYKSKHWYYLDIFDMCLKLLTNFFLDLIPIITNGLTIWSGLLCSTLFWWFPQHLYDSWYNYLLLTPSIMRLLLWFLTPPF